MLECYNIVSLKNVQDDGATLDERSKRRTAANSEENIVVPTDS
jgi:hypothetical protein